MQSELRKVVVCVAAGVLSACAAPAPFTPTSTPTVATDDRPGSVEPGSVGPAPSQPVAPDSTTPTPPTEPAPRARALSAASRALINQAHAQLAAGNDAMAAATLERALRIEPDQPALWLELAKVRQEEGNAAQAENLARKALSMAVGDAVTQAAAWRVIAQSYRARGRNQEARDAEVKAQALGR